MSEKEFKAVGFVLVVLLIIPMALVTFLTFSVRPDGYEEKKFLSMPKELEGCRVFYVSNKDGAEMTVARCPNSTATAEVIMGGTKQTTITIDGVEYAPANK